MLEKKKNKNRTPPHMLFYAQIEDSDLYPWRDSWIFESDQLHKFGHVVNSSSVEGEGRR